MHPSQSDVRGVMKEEGGGPQMVWTPRTLPISDVIWPMCRLCHRRVQHVGMMT
jgi:hypothetical protein